jgi:hypothetical protein
VLRAFAKHVYHSQDADVAECKGRSLFVNVPDPRQGSAYFPKKKGINSQYTMVLVCHNHNGQIIFFAENINDFDWARWRNHFWR